MDKTSGQLRIAILAPELLPPIGGAGVYAMNLVRELAKRPEVDLHVFTPRRGQGYSPENVRSYFGNTVYQTVIPRNVRVSEAPSHGKPVLLYDMRSAGSQAYIQLAGEILRREKELAA